MNRFTNWTLTWRDRNGATGVSEHASVESLKMEAFTLIVQCDIPREDIRVFQPQADIPLSDLLGENFDPDAQYCPHCKEVLSTQHNPESSIIYTCHNCSNIQFEFSTEHDVVNLIRYLYPNEKEQWILDEIATSISPRHAQATAVKTLPKSTESTPWVTLIKDAELPVSLSGVMSDGSVEYVVEIDGTTEYFGNFESAMHDYTTRVAKFQSTKSREKAS